MAQWLTLLNRYASRVHQRHLSPRVNGRQFFIVVSLLLLIVGGGNTAAIAADIYSAGSATRLNNHYISAATVTDPNAMAALRLQAQREIDAINAALRQPSPYASVPSTVNLWPTLIAHFALAVDDQRPAIRHAITVYLHNKKHLEQILYNARPYLYYVYQQTQQRGLPAEFALLPFVESGYNPFAYSAAGATGMWQMMPGTASGLGLNIDWWYDARRDTVVSTQAALNYLVSLHAALHDWLLTAAAYDSGINVVQTAERYNRHMGRQQNFWSLALPHETQAYVPKLLALVDIIRHAHYYHVTLPYIAARPYFAAINLNSQMDLLEVSQLAGVAPAVIHRLNPGMRRWATNPDGIYTLLVPSDRAQMFRHNIARMVGETHVSWQYHQVRIGETLAHIAKIYHTNVALLRQVNHLTSDYVVPMQGLLVPLYLHRTVNAPIAAAGMAASTQFMRQPATQHDATATRLGPENNTLKKLLGKIYSQENNGQLAIKMSHCKSNSPAFVDCK